MRAFVARKQYIYQLELLGAVAVYYSLPQVFAGRQVIHFIDNAAALAGLAKNASSAEDSAKVIHSFWALATALQIDVWFEYVASKANVADWPSRDDCSFVVDNFGSEFVPTVLPEIDSWGGLLSVRWACHNATRDNASLCGQLRCCRAVTRS